MFFSFLLISTLCNNKAVLYAGSGGWINYRHQADIWTIYQELQKRGINKEDIKIACYDDIAYHPNNPYKGQIFHDLDHKENVYGGSNALTYKNEITQLTLYETLSKLGTNENDNIFIFYDDHGGQGMLSIPNEEYGYISAQDLTTILKAIRDKKLFNKLIFFIEACNSGSIGDYFVANTNSDNIAIITAAKAIESSAADVYDIWTNSLLSNQFTNNFIKKIRQSPDCTINELFDYIYTNTDYSTPLFFGDESIKEMKISDFIGTTAPVVSSKIIKSNPIPQTKVSQMIYKEMLKSNFDRKQKKKIAEEYQKEKDETSRLMQILSRITKKLEPSIVIKSNERKQKDDLTLTQSYFEIFDHFSKKFGPIRANDLSQISTIVLKISKIAPKEKIIEIIEQEEEKHILIN